VGEQAAAAARGIRVHLRSRDTALEAAAALETFFGEDERLLALAGWLRLTAGHCAVYELCW
jgi:hypothetical protein